MWTYGNPVRIAFGADSFRTLPELIAGRRYAVVTYGEPFFHDLTARLASQAGQPLLVIDDVAPNPDYRLLGEQTARFGTLASQPEVIVALGGGSVIDSAKVFAAANGDFDTVRTFLETRQGGAGLGKTAIIAVPTTAGTGSEVTCWGTVWDEASGKKYSLASPDLYPTHAVIDPRLMAGKPRQLTISTGLDALSHALESLWNVSANPVSANHAVVAARAIIDVLPRLVEDLHSPELRERMAQAALFAGLAFSNTKTAIAHSLSYPITLRHGVQHGIACSFTLPAILRGMAGTGGVCGEALTRIFGDDLAAGADELERFLFSLGVSTDPAAHGIAHGEWRELVDHAFEGERGRNFIGGKDGLLALMPMTAPDDRKVA